MSLDWLPARALESTGRAKPRFWLIVRAGNTVVVRKGARMRKLSEKRTRHPDDTAADASFCAAIAKQLAAGYTDMLAGDLQSALLHHEPLVAELPRDVVRRAARELLALRTWRHDLAAQALVRTLGRGDGEELELARSLVARMGGG